MKKRILLSIGMCLFLCSISLADATKYPIVRLHVGGFAGSGVVINHDTGLILTAAHVVRDEKTGITHRQVKADVFDIKKFPAFKTIVGQVLCTNRDMDVALVRVDPKEVDSHVILAPKGYKIKNGTKLYTAGCSKGAPPSLAEVQVVSMGAYKNTVATTNAHMFGRSGGALIDVETDFLVGIISRTHTVTVNGEKIPAGLGFSADAHSYLTLMKACKIRRAYLYYYYQNGCKPCDDFKRDYQNDPAFRAAIDNSYVLKPINAIAHPISTLLNGVTRFPTFWDSYSGQVVVGYGGKEAFLKRLGLTMKQDVPKKVIPIEIPVLPAPVPEVKPEPRVDINARLEELRAQLKAEQDKALADIKKKSAEDHQKWLDEQKLVEQFKEVTPKDYTPEQTSPPVVEEEGVITSGLKWAGSAAGQLALLYATGGASGVGLGIWGLKAILRRRKRKRTKKTLKDVFSAGGAGSELPDPPLPRELDEAGQLLGLGKLEGRVAPLDALTGMFFEDAVNTILETSDDEAEKSIVSNLLDTIKERINKIAPISTKRGE